MFNKRGMTNEIFFNIFELVLAAIVLLSLLVFVKGIATQSIFEKSYLSRDIASAMNTIYAAPGDVDYNYIEKPKGYSFFVELKNSRAYVYEETEKNPEQRTSYPFAENKKIKLSYETIYASAGVNFKLSKNSSQITAEQKK